MSTRKFKKVTKLEIALGAVASLMTGVVVGCIMYGKKKKLVVKHQPVTHRPPMPVEHTDELIGASGMGNRGLSRRRPTVDHYAWMEGGHKTPFDLGGRPHSTTEARYADTHRYTGTRGK